MLTEIWETLKWFNPLIAQMGKLRAELRDGSDLVQMLGVGAVGSFLGGHFRTPRASFRA